MSHQPPVGERTYCSTCGRLWPCDDFLAGAWAVLRRSLERDPDDVGEDEPEGDDA